MATFVRTAFVEVVGSCGFTKKELATIYGVSRQTIYDWARGNSAPTQYALLVRAATATEALLAGIRAKKIPFPDRLPEESRAARINAIIKVIMESMKPGRT